MNARFSKLLSGRWILTVAAAVVFIYASVTEYLSAGDVKMILGIVITFYFTKRPNTGAETKGEKQ